ncbi:MAG: polysaccharide biosynthesis protein PslG [Solirubrobacteraceae bacterium]|nr:polysaccharide biosynthesis protein PslG [Solirubrobacteraceae bacterium]
MRLIAAAAVLVGLIAASPAGAAQRVPYRFFGVSVDGAMLAPSIDQAHEFGVMTKVGVEAITVEVNWNFLQPKQDRPPNYSRVDRVMLNAARRGMTALADVLYAPKWASVDPTKGASPPKPGPYAEFLRALVQRYGPEGSLWAAHPEVTPSPIRDWQVWNEPPSTGFWSAQPFQKRYVALLRYARFAIKGTDAGARVVLAGLTFKSWEDLGKIYAAGGKGLFDVVSLHPYTLEPANVKYIVKLNRRVMQQHGDGAMPIMITELSWPSAKGKSSQHYGYEVTPKEQAQKLAAVLPMLAAARKRLGIERVYWFSWLSTDRGHFTFDYSGLRTVRGTKVFDKPALAAYRKGALALEGCKRKGATVARCG